MDLLDVVILAVALVAAIGGYRLGFFTRVLSWVGLALGLYVAARFLPRIISAIELSNPAARLLVAVAVLVGAAFVGQAAGMLVGARLHAGLPWGPVRSLDKGIGAAVGVIGVLVVLWLLVPSITSVPGWPARAASHSAISRWVNDDLPQPPNAFEVLRRLVANDDLPQVFASLHPDDAVAPPPDFNPVPLAATRRAEASTVKVEGEACDRIQDGSGFAVADDLVVTNAHVVAGEPAGSTAVMLPSGTLRPATVVLYDPDRDVALLRVPGLDETPLPLAAGHAGQEGAVLGHPGGQNALAVQPESIARAITAVGEDLYDRHQTSRQVDVLSALLQPGDSGGPVVDQQGYVVGMAFAIALDSPDTAYALTSGEVEPDLRAARSGRPVSTQGCLDD